MRRFMDKYKISDYIYVLIMIGISIFRIFLAANTNYAVISGRFDDELAIHQGFSLLEGEWLGEYSMSTLIKGIAYPVFVALLRFFCIPYGIGIGIVMVFSTTVFVKMLKKFEINRIFRLLSYTFVLFNPAGFYGWTAIHIYRDVLTMWILLIFFSCTFVMYHDCELELKKNISWIIGAVCSFTVMCFLREDTIWLFPYTVCSFLIVAIKRTNGNKKLLRCLKLSLFTLLPWVSALLVGTIISFINYCNYGLLCVNDRTQGPFAEMMEIIYQVEDNQVDEEIWITEEMLQKCIDASPTMNTMKNEILQVYTAYANGEENVKGDYVQWVLRRAFNQAGYYNNNPLETHSIVETIANELNLAMKTRIISNDHKLHISAQGRGLSIDELFYYIPVSLKNLNEIIDYEGCVSHYPYYPKAESGLVAKFENMLSTSFSKSTIDSNVYLFVEKVYVILENIYSRIGDNLFYFCGICWLFLFTVEFYNKKKNGKSFFGFQFSVPLIGMLISGFLLIYMITIFTTFLTKYNFYNYTTGIYTIILIYEILIVNFFIKAILKLINSKK